MNTIFVTGGAGFIGSAVIRYLLKNTNKNIVNIDKLTYAGNLNSIPKTLTDKNKERYFFEKIDICNKLDLKRLFLRYKPDGVIHLAAESHVDRSIDNADDFIKTNIIGTYNLLEISRHYLSSIDSKKSKNFKFHHVSTDEVYGDLKLSDDSFKEETRYDPSSPYSASKASSDHLVRAWGRTYRLPIVITNCSNNYGPYHFPEKLIPLSIINAIRGNHLPVYGSGQQIRDWLYVDDHAEALVKVLSDGKLGETYNIGGNNEMKNIDVVIFICNLLDKKIDNKPFNVSSFSDLIKYVDDRPGHDMRYSINNSKIKNNLGWSPQETFETGIEKTVDWFLNNRQWWEDILKSRYNLTRLGNSKKNEI